MGSPSFFDINVLGFVALEGLPFQLESIIVSIFLSLTLLCVSEKPI
jgi:hypothetical protein